MNPFKVQVLVFMLAFDVSTLAFAWSSGKQFFNVANYSARRDGFGLSTGVPVSTIRVLSSGVEGTMAAGSY